MQRDIQEEAVLLSFKNSYHGSTHGALSIQGNELYKNAFRPLLPDTFQIGFNDEKSLDAIDKNTACVIVEPVQGEAGVILPESGFLEKIRNTLQHHWCYVDF